MRKVYAAFATVIMVSGCASVAIPTDVPAIPVNADLQALLKVAGDRSTFYAGISQDLHKEEVYVDMGLLGLATAAAATLFYSKGIAQRNETFGIALAAASASTGRTYFNPLGAADAYALASRQLNCVATTGAGLLSATPDSPLFVNLAHDEHALQTAITHSQNVQAQVTNPTAAVVVSAMATLSNAVNDGTKTLSLAENEKAAANSIQLFLENIFTTINNNLASGLSQRPIDYATTLQNLLNAAQQKVQVQTGTQPQSGAPSGGPVHHAQIAGGTPQDDANELLAAAATVQAASNVVKSDISLTKVVSTEADIANCLAAK